MSTSSTTFLSKLKSFGRTALAAFKNGSWPSVLTFLATLAGTVGVLDTGEVSNVKVAVGAALSLLTAGTAVVHGFHVHLLTLAQAESAATQTVTAVASAAVSAPDPSVAPTPAPTAEATPTTPAPVPSASTTEPEKPVTPPAAA